LASISSASATSAAAVLPQEAGLPFLEHACTGDVVDQAARTGVQQRDLIRPVTAS
jgi:hypothetical protein